MQKVIGLNLNGNAYQVEEPGYAALRAYLDEAEATLKDNPDRAEILGDLEQAIADKCQGVLGPHKSVVTSADVDRILAEMGPVEAGASATGTADEKAAGGSEDKKADASAPRKLYQLREGAMLSGVCNGLAAYFDLDVTVIRVAFVVLAVLTKGVWLLVYAILSFIVPYANTPEEKAAARGRRFSAQDVVDQAKRNYAELKHNPAWKRQWRMQGRQWRRQWRAAMHNRWTGPSAPWVETANVWGGVVSPLYAIVNIALIVLLVLAIVSLAKTHALFGYAIPPDMPLWMAILIVIIVYQVIASPFHLSRRLAVYQEVRAPAVAAFEPFIGLVWLGFIAFAIWYGYHHVPAVHDFIQRLPAIWSDFVHDVRSAG